MIKSVIILFTPKDGIIQNVKYGDYEYLLTFIESFTVVAMKLKEQVLFFKVEDDEKKYIDYLLEHSLQHVSYLKKFKNAQYNI